MGTDSIVHTTGGCLEMASNKHLAGISVSVPAGVFWYMLIFAIGALAIFGAVFTASLLNLEAGSFLESGMIVTLYIIVAAAVGLSLFITFEHFTFRRAVYIVIAGAIAGGLASSRFVVQPFFEALGAPELVTVTMLVNVGIGALIMVIAVPYIANIDLKKQNSNSYISIFLFIMANVAFFAPPVIPTLWANTVVANNVQGNFAVITVFSAVVLVAGVASGIMVGAMAHWALRGPTKRRDNLLAKQ